MENFKNYLISEYKEKAKGFVAVDTKFSHSNCLKIDKKTKKTLKKDIIKVSIKFFNKDLKLLYTANLQFENNILPKSKAETLINISPKELENKFAFAKKEICEEIYKELKEKQDEIQLKIENLAQYIGKEGIIPSEFKGETIKVVENTPEENKHKQVFEM